MQAEFTLETDNIEADNLEQYCSVTIFSPRRKIISVPRRET